MTLIFTDNRPVTLDLLSSGVNITSFFTHSSHYIILHLLSCQLLSSENTFESLLKCDNSQLNTILQVHSTEQGVQWDYHLFAAHFNSSNAD